MAKFILNIDQKFQIWQNMSVEVEFNGTKEELEQYLKDGAGNFNDLDPEYLSTEFLTETEEYLEEYDLHDIEEYS